MKENRKNIIFVSAILMTLLLVPSVIQLAHAFEDHEHIACSEKGAHLHEDTPECKICDFHLTSFDYQLYAANSAERVILLKEDVQILQNVVPLPYSFSNKQLRAPPSTLS